MTKTTWTSKDRLHMAEAIRLARLGLYTTDPNPRVGCVIVSRDDQVVGRGWHQRAGEAHAEVKALEEAGLLARDAIAYVTLEPCSHHGKTGPCAEALIKAGISQVIVAMKDPNPLVSGRGIARLAEAGVVVSVGLLEQEAEALNPGFIQRMKNKRPFVRIKMAMSLDGRTAMSSGESKWITGPEARADVQRLRARSSAILSGSGTVLDDNPALTVRMDKEAYQADQVRQPGRVIVDWTCRLSGTERVFEPGTSVFYICMRDERNVADRGKHIEVLPFAGDKGVRPPLSALLEALAARECNELLVETGASLAGAFVEQGCWDELVVYVAPKLMGSTARPLFQMTLDSMNQSHGLKLTDMRQVGSDLRLTYRPE